MSRREFIALAATVAVWPIGARAQQPEGAKRIAVLVSYAENDPEAQVRLRVLKQGLQKLGWTEGHNLQLDVRWTAGDIKLVQTYTAELVGLTRMSSSQPIRRL